MQAILDELKKGGNHEWHMLDGSIVKVHQDATRSCFNKPDEAIGASVGGLSTKAHAKVDSFGTMDENNSVARPGS